MSNSLNSSSEKQNQNNNYISSSCLSSDFDIDSMSIKENYQDNVNIPTSPTSMFSITANKLTGRKMKGKDSYLNDTSYLSNSSSPSFTSSSMSIGSLNNIIPPPLSKNIILSKQNLNESINNVNSNNNSKRNQNNNDNLRINTKEVDKNKTNMTKEKKFNFSINLKKNNFTNTMNDTFEDLSFNISNVVIPSTSNINSIDNTNNFEGKKSHLSEKRSFSAIPFSSITKTKSNQNLPISAPNSSFSFDEGNDNKNDIYDDNTRKSKDKNKEDNNKYHDQDQLIAVLESITQVTKNFQEGNFYSNS